VLQPLEAVGVEQLGDDAGWERRTGVMVVG
jgi:hypothetical protein